jgi:hypothetical protein
MKMKAIKLFSMAVAALMMAACSNEDNDVQQPAQQARMIPFEATIGPAGASTRTTITEGTGTDAGKLMVAWKGGEKIALVHNGKKDEVEVTTVNLDGSAVITGSIDATGTDGEAVVLVYPADAVKSVTSGTTYVPNTDDAFLAIGLQQDGTLEYIGNNLDAREGSETLKISSGTATLNDNVTMESKIAVWKLTLTTDGTTPLAANQVTLSIGTNPIAATAVNATGKSEWTLCVVPATLALYSGNFTVTAKVGSDTYTYTKAGGVSLTKNTYYQSTVTLSKPAPALIVNPAVGQVIGADGKNYADVAAATAAETTAVAMIAYVGSGSDCEHGLAIQLNSSPVQKDRSEAGTYAEGLTAVPGGTWRLPSKADWQNMFLGCAKSGDASSASENMNPISGFKEKIAATGITWKSDKYWSSQDYMSYAADVEVVLYGSNAYAAFAWEPKSNSHYVLGCLAF